ncbi:unnamed protein product [Nyctereutes procyonoides]|uniref:(raccoon dog) hypothetical protein n=1 Tax=Nyctereutes procyonoides TaxID=34880 RepID=A0A811ZXY9_NYCPR|nr:unnamed protein product [Nyctereutes procyonoides]
MEAPPHPKPAQDKTFKNCSMTVVIFLPLLALFTSTKGDPHALKRLTWQVLTSGGDEVWSITKTAPVGTWWPNLYPDLCKLTIGAPSPWDLEGYFDTSRAPNQESPPGRLGLDPWGGCGTPERRAMLSTLPFYVCPGHHRDRRLNPTCGGGEYFYCKNWGCETTGDTEWRPSSSWDYITVKANYTHPTFSKWKTLNYGPCQGWSRKKGYLQANGYTWGLRLYKERTDDGFIFRIKLKLESPDPVAIGPNVVLGEQRAPAKLTAPALAAGSATPTNFAVTPTPRSSPEPPEPGQRLFNLIIGAFLALNRTSPVVTRSCWLCLASPPPYYEGIATSGTYNNITSTQGCTPNSQPQFTLTEVSGQGTCIGTHPRGYQRLCNTTTPILGTDSYLEPQSGTWWACNKGLTPCVSAKVLNSSNDFCVMVQIIPRVFYHPAETLENQYDKHPTRFQREPVSLTLAVMLGLGVAAGVGTGAAALIQDSRRYIELQTAVDEDLRTLEQSVSKLEQSLPSLSEVALQNRRGLDLLFLKEGGLCAALGEECCFYADHSGVIRDSMAKLRERLNKRQRDREAQQGWFESWFNQSPWLTTLISTIMGPLVILLLLLTFGPTSSTGCSSSSKKDCLLPKLWY